ncbi:MAG: DUF1254 domain-containing protein [Rhodomicrobium sp.]|nr:DUF1254 domain-containing protein [Rhodomicrobium sp.]
MLASVFCAGIIHILAVFGVPYVASQDAWARLSKIGGLNQIYVMPVAANEPPLPFMAPDIAYAFCRYDLTSKNVLVKTPIGDAAWSIAVSGRYGENFYFISGAEAKRRELRLLLVPRARLSEEASTERSEEGEEQIIVITPEMLGIVTLRAPIRGPSFAAETVNMLQAAECGTVTEEPVDPATLSVGVGLPVQRPATGIPTQ